MTSTTTTTTITRSLHMHFYLIISIILTSSFLNNSNLCVFAARKCSKKSCNDLQINPTINGLNDRVCAVSDFGAKGEKECSSERKYSAAVKWCEKKGHRARLCTKRELLNNEAANSGCGYDRVEIWSKTKCSKGHIVVRGENGQRGRCVDDNTVGIYVRCCADVHPCPGQGDTVQIVYDFSFLSETANIESIYSDLSVAKGGESICEWTDYPNKLPRRNYEENVFIDCSVPSSSPSLCSLGLRTVGVKVLDRARVQVAEVIVDRSDILYGKFKVSAKMPSQPGTKFEFALFSGSSVHIGIEILTEQLANPPLLGSYPIGISVGKSHFSTIYVDFDPRRKFHEYGFLWSSGKVVFQIDGTSREEVTKGVPKNAAQLLVNHWTNGDATDMGGPPQDDSVAHLQWIEIEFEKQSDSDFLQTDTDIDTDTELVN